MVLNGKGDSSELLEGKERRKPRLGKRYLEIKKLTTATTAVNRHISSTYRAPSRMQSASHAPSHPEKKIKSKLGVVE